MNRYLVIMDTGGGVSDISNIAIIFANDENEAKEKVRKAYKTEYLVGRFRDLPDEIFDIINVDKIKEIKKVNKKRNKA